MEVFLEEADFVIQIAEIAWFPMLFNQSLSSVRRFVKVR